MCAAHQIQGSSVDHIQNPSHSVSLAEPRPTENGSSAAYNPYSVLRTLAVRSIRCSHAAIRNNYHQELLNVAFPQSTPEACHVVPKTGHRDGQSWHSHSTGRLVPARSRFEALPGFCPGITVLPQITRPPPAPPWHTWKSSMEVRVPC